MKCWKKFGENVWLRKGKVTDNAPSVIRVDKAPKPIRGYNYYFRTTKTMTNPKQFRTEREAMSYAKKFMKRENKC